MKVLFATTNPAKIKYYAEKLIEKGIEILTIKDLDISIDINENGKNAVENSIIKAKAYYEMAKITTIAIDDTLYIEGLPEEKQPGANVRRINGKKLEDYEMLEYYSNLVKKLGGIAKANWVKGVAIYDGEKLKTFEYNRSDFYFVDKKSEKINEGYPLDSLTIVPEFNKYLSELTKEDLKKYKEKNNNKDIFDFLMQNL